MNRLLEVGFQPAGHWYLVDDDLSFDLTRHASQSNILYAFVSDGEVKYVGKTTQTLSKRLYGYKRPGASQATNIRNSTLIKELLRNGAAVDILALPDNGMMHYGQFHLNLAAGLEDSVISVVKPAWNGKPATRALVADSGEDGSATPTDSFAVVIRQSSFNQGFFNVPVAHSSSFADDCQTIEILCQGLPRPIVASVNRTANINKTPRVMGGSGLRDWFQSNIAVMQEIMITVYSRDTIGIQAASK